MKASAVWVACQPAFTPELSHIAPLCLQWADRAETRTPMNKEFESMQPDPIATGSKRPITNAKSATAALEVSMPRSHAQQMLACSTSSNSTVDTRVQHEASLLLTCSCKMQL